MVTCANEENKSGRGLGWEVFVGGGREEGRKDFPEIMSGERESLWAMGGRKSIAARGKGQC